MRRIVLAEGVVCAELDDEAVLLDVERGTYHGLDEVGFRIWTLLGEGCDASAIVDHLIAEYDAPPTAIRADLGVFIEALLAQGLVRQVAPAGASDGPEKRWW